MGFLRGNEACKVRDPRFDHFPITVRVRLKCTDYGRLLGDWKVVTLNSIDEWAHIKDELLKGYRQKFGIMRTMGGEEVTRWNDRTWEQMLPLLVVEKFDLE